MYTHDAKQMTFEEFTMPLGGKLSPENRRVKQADAMPWDFVEEVHHSTLSGSGRGAPAISARMAFAALVIREHLGLSDEECVEQIRENPLSPVFLRDNGVFGGKAL